MTKILNFGSLNIDYVYTLDHFVKPGETIHSVDRQVFAGGKGLNQSIAAKRAGAEVYHAGAIGIRDSALLLDTLENDAIDTKYIKKIDSPSGHTVIQVNSEGQNSIILFGGSNQEISLNHIDSVLNEFNAGDFLILQNEINNIEYIIEKAYEIGLKICFNVSPFEQDLLKLPLKKCRYLIVNEIEGAALVDKSSDTDAEVLIDLLSKKFSQTCIVLTLGVKGSYFKDIDADPIFVKAHKVNAIDTTAAGDTYLGYLIAMLSLEKKATEALQIATAASALAVTKKGACPSIPKIDDVMTFLSNN